MANRSSADVGFLLIGGNDCLGVTTTLTEDPFEALLELTHALGDGFEESSDALVRKWSLSQDGFYDDAANGYNAALVGLGSKVLLYGLAGNVIGRQAVAGDVEVKKYKRDVTRGELHKASAEYAGDGVPNRGLVSIEHATVTAAIGNSSTSINNGALTTTGAIFDIGLSALTLDGGSSLTIRLEDSADNSAWATVSGITVNLTTAPQAVRLMTAAGATIRQYTRTAYVFNGSGAGRSAKLATVLSRGIT